MGNPIGINPNRSMGVRLPTVTGSVHAAVASILNVVALEDADRASIAHALQNGWTSERIIASAKSAARHRNPMVMWRAAAAGFKQSPPPSPTSSASITLIEAIDHAQARKTQAEQSVITDMANKDGAVFTAAVERLITSNKRITVPLLKAECLRIRAASGDAHICEYCGDSGWVDGPPILDVDGQSQSSAARCHACNNAR